MPRFAYFGTPYVARDTLELLFAAGYVPTVVITSPPAPKGRGLTLTPSDTEVWAREHDISVLTPATLTAEIVEEISSYNCEFAIAVAYGKIIPQALIDAFPKGILNIHYSLLPKYRGASPVEMALRNGDSITGVTIQQMVYELDAGDILAQRQVPIAETDTTRTLRPILIKEGADLLIETLPKFVAGEIEPIPQHSMLASRAPKISKAEGELSLEVGGRENWNTYRGLIESPGTYFFAEKEGKSIRVKIAEAQLVDGEFVITRIVPEGKSEQPFSYLAQNGWKQI